MKNGHVKANTRHVGLPVEPQDKWVSLGSLGLSHHIEQRPARGFVHSYVPVADGECLSSGKFRIDYMRSPEVELQWHMLGRLLTDAVYNGHTQKRFDQAQSGH